METALAWLQGLSAPLQIITIVVLVLIFKDDISAFFRRKVIGQNGENLSEKSSKDWFDDIAGLFATLESNHVAHLQTRMDEILDMQKDIKRAIEAIEKYGIKCRKE